MRICEKLRELIEMGKSTPKVTPKVTRLRKRRHYRKVKCVICDRKIGANNWSRHIKTHVKRVVEEAEKRGFDT